jgi:DNA-binding MarR family transcriptional regulator
VAKRTAEAAAASVELTLAMTRLRARLRAESRSAEGWTTSQLSALARIVREGPVTASALAVAEHVRPQSIGEIVAALKGGGLVAATPDPNDGRKTLLSATAAGRKLVRSLAELREAWLTRAIEAVVDESRRHELTAAVALLNSLAECDPDVAPRA